MTTLVKLFIVCMFALFYLQEVMQTYALFNARGCIAILYKMGCKCAILLISNSDNFVKPVDSLIRNYAWGQTIKFCISAYRNNRRTGIFINNMQLRQHLRLWAFTCGTMRETRDFQEIVKDFYLSQGLIFSNIIEPVVHFWIYELAYQ